jgi:hypothetical protein
VQQEIFQPADDVSPDSQDRIRDFLARHGGPGSPGRLGEVGALGECGWSEVYAADGYKLRCEWSRMGSREEMTFAEIPPQPEAAPHPAARVAP